MKTRILILGVAALATLGLVGCGGKHTKPNIELIQDMMETPACKAQAAVKWDRTEPCMRMPPKGTIPRNFQVFKYAGHPNQASKNLKNPIAGQFTPEVLKKGREDFETYCLECHGAQGLGNGPVSVKMPVKPFDLMSDQARKFTDGFIFYVITEGYGVMGRYNDQIVNPLSRWKVVNYVRSMQKSYQAEKSGK